MNHLANSHNRNSIVSLVYGGIKSTPPENILSCLNKNNLQGTFFFDSKDNIDYLNEWKRLLENNHEIGNGALLSAALADGSLPRWTPEMIAECINQDDTLLHECFGLENTPICLPLGSARCAINTDYTPMLPTKRMILSGVYGINNIRKRYVKPYYRIIANGMSMEDILHVIETMASSSWLVIYFDVSGEVPLFDENMHREICENIIQHPLEVHNTTLNKVYLSIPESVKKSKVLM